MIHPYRSRQTVSKWGRLPLLRRTSQLRIEGLSLEPLEDRCMLAAWAPVGPASILGGQTAGLTDQDDPVSGAVQVVAPHPTDANILYIGAVNGGIWRTNNAQASSPTWTPLTDQLMSLSIGDLQFDPTDATHNTLIAGLGRFSSLARDGDDLKGLIRSTDGGSTWTEITGNGLLLSKNVTSVAARGNVIVVAVNGATPFSLDNIGIFRSTDGGSSFSHVSGATSGGLPLGRSLEMVADPVDPQVLYAALSDGGASNGIYKSSDTGATWTRVSNAEMDALITDAGSQRTSNVQMSVGSSNNVFVGIVNGGLLAAVYRSGDGGTSWTAMDVPSTNENGTNVGINPIKTGPKKPDGKPLDDPGGQGAIHFSLVADPNNSNIVYAGGDRQPRGALDQGNWPNAVGATNFTGRLFRGDASLAAGSQWTALTDNFADSDGPDGPLPGTGPHADSRDMAFDAAGSLIEGDDGGVYKRLSPTQSTGVWRSVNGNLQITEFVSVAYSSLTNTVIGGAQDVGTSLQVSSNNNVWQQFAQGDGGVTGIDDSQPGISIRYGSSQFLGNFGRATFDAANNFVSYAVASLVGLADSPQFYTPYELNEVQPARLVMGTQTRIYESLDQGDTVTDLGAIGTAQTLAYGGRSGGVDNPDVLYVGTDSGLFLRTSAGGSLQSVSAYPGDTPQDIVLDPQDWRRAFVVDSSGVFMTPDAGQTWTELTFNLVDSRLRSVEFITAATGPTGIVVGGNSGVSVMLLGESGFWQVAATGLPGAPVIDLHFNSIDNVLLAGTLGRGAWIVESGSDILFPLGLEVSDIILLEGNDGFTEFVFFVTQPQNTPTVVTVTYATSSGTAVSEQDYAAQGGVLTFALGETSKSVTIQVVADLVVESNESFFITLSDAVNAAISKKLGTGTILNDDVDVSIGDAVIVEGNSGSRELKFAITTFGTINKNIVVSYSTLNNTADGAADYLPRAGSVLLTQQSIGAVVTVPIVADILDEDDEQFSVVLAAIQGARIADSTGIGTILDDDPLPSFYVNDVQITTTDAGNFAAVFTVGLDAPAGRTVTVNFATIDQGAVAGVDYQGLVGALSFAPGQRTRTVAVPITTGAVYSPDKKFGLALTSPTNSLLADSLGIATIVFASGPVEERIIDNGDVGYSRSINGWNTLTNTLAYGLDYDYRTAGNGNSTASYTFNGLANGSYQVLAKWIPFSNRATNAPYTILNGATPISTVLVNQQLAPAGEVSNGIIWQSLGTFDTTTGALVVRLGDNANGYVIADAIRLVPGGIGPQSPEINIASSEISIATGDTAPSAADGTDFGITALNTDSAAHTFTVVNNGNAVLNLGGLPRVAITGAAAGDFLITAQPGASINPNGSTNFVIVFRPTAAGLRQATVTIANNDSDEGPYSFTIQGTGEVVASPFGHNADLPQDVNADNRVSTSDVLILVNNLLRKNEASPLSATATAAAASSYYLDVSGDGRVSTSDLLMVVNYILRTSAAPQVAPAAAIAELDTAEPLSATAVDAAFVLFDDTSDSAKSEAAPQVVAALAAGSEPSNLTSAASSLLSAAEVSAAFAGDDDDGDEANQASVDDWDLLALDV